MLRLLHLILLESEMILLKVVLREAWSVSYYDFELLLHSPFGHFICEFKGSVNAWAR